MNEIIDDVESFRREAVNPRYAGNGISVTRALRRAGLVKFFVSPTRLAELAEEGTAVHMACGDIAKGAPDYWSEIGWLEPYARAFAQFTKDHDFRAEAIETRVEHPAGYFGFLDMAGPIRANSKRPCLAVVEIKRAVPARPYALQVAAYQRAMAIADKRYSTAIRLCLYLRANGTYKIEEHGSPFDFVYFQHALGIARLRESWGLVSRDDEKRFDDILCGRRPSGASEFDEAPL